MEGLDPTLIDGGLSREITFSFRDETRRFASGLDYLVHSAIPNFPFHVTTADAILRHNGCDLQKSDFIGPLGR